MLDTMVNALDNINGIGGKPRNSTSTNVHIDKGTEFFARLIKANVNLDELGCILTETENTLIISCAGSGKTTALILKILYDLYTGFCYKVVEIPSASGVNTVRVPANILVTTFLKSGAEDLKKSFNEWSQRLGINDIDTSKIVFRTMHAEVYQALKSMGVEISIVTDNSKYTRAAMKTYGVRSMMSRSKQITVDEVRDVEGILAYARNRLDKAKYTHPLMSDYNMDEVILNGMLKNTKTQRRLEGVMDYEDLQELLLDAIQKNPAVKEAIQQRYDFIYCDEFQDTSQLQYALLQYYFDSAKRVICIGDDDQCIYSWRGSDINIITSYYKEDYKPKVYNLSTNYRCKANILNAVIPSITENKNRSEKSIKAAVGGGELKVLYNHSVSELIKSVKYDVYDGKTVSIISRTNNDLLIPALILELGGGIDYSVSKQLGFGGRLPRFVFGCIELLTKRYSENFEEYLKQVLPFSYKDEATQLCEILASNQSLGIFNIDEEDLASSVPYLYSTLLRSLREYRNGVDGEKTAYDYLLYVIRETFVGRSAYAKKARDLIDYTLDLVHSDLCQGMTLYELDTLFNNTLPTRLASRTTRVNAPVKLTTVHEAKGKEWDSVYIWNDCDGIFPAQVGNREISQDEYEEERRIHYIAWTRAKDKLTVFSTQGVISPFLRECDYVPDIAEYKVRHQFKMGNS